MGGHEKKNQNAADTVYQQEEEGDKTTTHVIYTGIRSVWAPPSDGCLQYGCNTSLMTGSA